MALTLEKGSDKFLKHPNLLILGPPKHGKTSLCATYSKHFRGWPSPDKVVFLDDLLWIGFDPNALEGLVGQGYDAPIVDLSAKTGVSLLPALEDCASDLPKLIKQLGTRAVVVNTGSVLDKNANEYWASVFKNSNNKFDQPKAVGITHNRFVSVLKSLGVSIFALAHAKTDMLDMSDPATIAREKASGLPGSGGISSQITGQTKGTYEGLVDMILPMQARPKQGKGLDGKPVMEFERVMYPRGGNGFEGAGRYLRFLDQEEPADLTKMFAKIRARYEAEV